MLALYQSRNLVWETFCGSRRFSHDLFPCVDETLGSQDFPSDCSNQQNDFLKGSSRAKLKAVKINQEDRAEEIAGYLTICQ